MMTGMKYVIVLATILLQLRLTHQSCQRGTWKKLNRKPRCVGAKGDRYARLRYDLDEPKFLAAIKFVHLRGQIRCKDAVVHNSNWGCSFNLHSSLNMFVTDWKNHVIFPKKKQHVGLPSGRWYGLPGFNEISPILVISDFANPLYMYSHQRLRVWYGEDLFDHSEDDNHGTVCMDVYGYLF